MKQSFYLTSAMVAVLALGGCVTQQQADAKMGKGCEAAISATIAPKKLLGIKSTNYADEKTEGSLYRRITIVGQQKDGWIEAEKTYTCLFAQDWGFFKSTHFALLEQLAIGDFVLGKVDGQIRGSMEDYVKLNETAETAMGQ